MYIGNREVDSQRSEYDNGFKFLGMEEILIAREMYLYVGGEMSLGYPQVVRPQRQLACLSCFGRFVISTGGLCGYGLALALPTTAIKLESLSVYTENRIKSSTGKQRVH